jgi:hypothetical protein
MGISPSYGGRERVGWQREHICQREAVGRCDEARIVKKEVDHPVCELPWVKAKDLLSLEGPKLRKFTKAMAH